MDIEDFSKLTFLSETHGPTTIEQMIKLIQGFMDERPNDIYKLVIGTDSHEKNSNNGTNGKKEKKAKREISLVTAVVIHRKGFGGRYFWHKQNPKEVHSLREKIKEETSASLMFALSFVPELRKSLNGHSPLLEIHLDVGNNGETRKMINEVVGMITGNGFEAKTKPDSYAASKVADKHT